MEEAYGCCVKNELNKKMGEKKGKGALKRKKAKYTIEWMSQGKTKWLNGKWVVQTRKFISAQIKDNAFLLELIMEVLSEDSLNWNLEAGTELKQMERKGKLKPE